VGTADHQASTPEDETLSRICRVDMVAPLKSTLPKRCEAAGIKRMCLADQTGGEKPKENPLTTRGPDDAAERRPRDGTKARFGLLKRRGGVKGLGGAAAWRGKGRNMRRGELLLGRPLASLIPSYMIWQLWNSGTLGWADTGKSWLPASPNRGLARRLTVRKKRIWQCNESLLLGRRRPVPWAREKERHILRLHPGEKKAGTSIEKH